MQGTKSSSEEGARTLDHKVKSLALYRLSYPGWSGGATCAQRLNAGVCVACAHSLVYVPGCQLHLPAIAKLLDRRCCYHWSRQI